MVKNRLVRINIDDFILLQEFEFFLFSLIKKSSNIRIIIYTIKQDDNILKYISNIFIYKIDKIRNYIEKKNIIFKLINFPYCLITDEKLILKYYINKLFLNNIDIINSKNLKCLECKFYITCMKFNNINSKVIPFKWLLVLKKDIIYILNFISYFFIRNWLLIDDFTFTLFFNINKHFKWIDNSILNKISIIFSFEDEKFDKYFYDNKNRIWSNIKVNLFFKNYIFQKKFNKLLETLSISIDMSYISKNNKNYNDFLYNRRLYNDKFYYTFSKNELYTKVLLSMDINTDKIVMIWDSIKFNSNLVTWILNLKVVSLDNLINIKNDFKSYIVLIWNQNINSYIPLIYKFRYFLSFSSWFDNNITSHYKIISREIWAIYIDNIKTDYFFWLENNSIIEINPFTWLIKRIW